MNIKDQRALKMKCILKTCIHKSFFAAVLVVFVFCFFWSLVVFVLSIYIDILLSYFLFLFLFFWFGIIFISPSVLFNFLPVLIYSNTIYIYTWHKNVYFGVYFRAIFWRRKLTSDPIYQLARPFLSLCLSLAFPFHSLCLCPLNDWNTFFTYFPLFSADFSLIPFSIALSICFCYLLFFCNFRLLFSQ